MSVMSEIGKNSVERSSENAEHHLEFFFREDRVRVLGGHHDGFAFVHDMRFPVNREISQAVKARHEGVAVGLMRADFFALVKGQKRDADEGILGERLAHDLAFLVADLIFLRQDFSFAEVFHGHGLLLIFAQMYYE